MEIELSSLEARPAIACHPNAKRCSAGMEQDELCTICDYSFKLRTVWLVKTPPSFKKYLKISKCTPVAPSNQCTVPENVNAA